MPLRIEYFSEFPVAISLILLMSFVFGICIGSFLNVCIFRIPLGESLTKKSSHCMTCGEPIKWYDLFPIFSWLFLKGKCRGCGEKISRRYPLVETLTGVVFVITTIILNDLSWDLLFTLLFFCALIVIAFIDWDTQEMNVLILLFTGVLAIPSFFLTDRATLTERLIGLVVISVPFLIIALATKGIGMGDVILMACAGAYLGFKPIIVSAFVGIFIAAVVGICIKVKKKTSQFAFGPWLCIGIFFGTFFGNTLANWYLSFIRP